MNRPKLGKPPGAELAGERRQGRGEGDRIRREIQEQQALPVGGGDRFEGVLLRVETGNPRHVGGGAQGSVQPVGPGVVRTLNGVPKLAARSEAEAAAAMTPEIVEGADRALA